MNRIDPVLDIGDMLPDGSNEYNPPGLTLGYIPMPCLSIVIWRRNIVICSDNSDAAWTRAVLVHSPELPQFSTVQLETIPWTVLLI